MNLKICGLWYKNIRGVRNLDISFEKAEKEPYPVTLIMMPNGAGKTTTIALLRAMLDEQVMEEYIIKDFKPDRSDIPKGEFGVKLIIDDLLYYIVLNLDYEKGEASYSTTKVSTVSGGMESGFNIRQSDKDMLSKEFVKRFIFDGELAKEILSTNSSEAETSLKFLFQLNRVGELRVKIKNIVEQAENAMENTSTRTQQGITNLRNFLDKAQKNLNKLNNRSNLIQLEIIGKQKRINEIDNVISEKIKANSQLRARAEKLIKKKNENADIINETTQNSLESVRSPYLLHQNIADRIEGLSNKLQHLKLPRTTSSQFFEDLARESTCVCGRTIGENEKKIIIERASTYLAEDQIGVINAIKQAVKDKKYTDELKNNLQFLTLKLAERQELKTEWDRLEFLLEEAGDTEIQGYNTEKIKLENELCEFNQELIKLLTEDKEKLKLLSWQENIYLCSMEVTSIDVKLSEASNTLNLSKRAKIVIGYLGNIENETLNILKEKIINQTNEKIKLIIKNDIIYIESIDGNLHLKNKNNASEGQTLAIAYSYLGSMFANSLHELPFIVDSPAGALDLDVRREVSEILPGLFKQLIVFITSGERKGFAEHFYKLSSDVQFLTISSTKGDDAVLIEGVDDFKKFQDIDSNII